MYRQPRYSPHQVRSILAGLHGGLHGQARLPIKTVTPAAKMPTVSAAPGTAAELAQLQNLLKTQQAALKQALSIGTGRPTTQSAAINKQIADTKARIAKTQAEVNTVYKDAAGNVITKAEYDRLVALAQSGQQVTVYKDADGNVITEAQYNQLVAEYQASLNQTKQPVPTTYCKTGQILVDGKCTFPAVSDPLPKNTGIVPPVAATPEVVKQVLQANAQNVTPIVVPSAPVAAPNAQPISTWALLSTLQFKQLPNESLPADSPTLQIPAGVQVGIPASASAAIQSQPVVTSYSQAAADPAITYTSAGPAAEAAPVEQTTVDVPLPDAPAPASTAKTVATVGLVAAIPLVMGFLGDK